MKKTQRNDLCPYGSKKKFKRCCLDKTTSIPSLEVDREWQNLREMEGNLSREVFTFTSEKWGAEILVDGWDAFCLDMDLKKDSPDGEQLFPGWFIFRWVPFDYSEKWKHVGRNVTLADFYVQKHGLQEYASFLSAVDQNPFSFFLVEDVIPFRRLILKDLLLERTITIKESAGASQELKGKVVFARVISCGDQSIQVAFGTTPLPGRYSLEVLDIKKEILQQEKKLTPAILLKYDNDLRKAYFEWAESAYQLPCIRNNEGDPIVFSTLHYKLVCSPKIAFDKISSLCNEENPADILEDGIFDKQDELYSIQFPWLENRSTNRVLGDMKIEGSKLLITVNSTQRSKKIQQEIEKRLPEASLVKEDIETLDLENIKKKKLPALPQPTAREKEMLRAHIKDYYIQWLDIPLPALKGKTPRQAAKTTEGRERLELLLFDFESNNPQDDDPLRIDIQSLRHELGLNR
ncbi:MAG: SEC-C domain-containing protein [Chlamydiales bacterium]|nr:SEC-C domain-containing protein [Chlamydiales bacterium]